MPFGDESVRPASVPVYLQYRGIKRQTRRYLFLEHRDGLIPSPRLEECLLFIRSRTRDVFPTLSQ